MKGRKGPQCIPALERKNRLRSASSAHVTAAAFPLLSNPTRIHSKISKSKPNFWQDLQDQICLLGIHLLQESLKRTMNDSQTDYQFQWVKVRKCNICLAGACLHIHAQLFCSPRGHKNSQNEQDPTGTLYFHRHADFFFFFFFWLTDWRRYMGQNDSGFCCVFLIWWCKDKEEKDGKHGIGIFLLPFTAYGDSLRQEKISCS